MNTFQIDSILKRCSLYRGTYACDELPSKASEGVYVCNTDNSEQPGEHWIAIYIGELGNVEYFDSYGFPPMNTYFIQFLKHNADTVKYNRQILQGLNSHVCGHYAIFFCLCKQMGLTLEEIENKFTLNTAHNDELVFAFICRFMGECY
jgi:hypothetical protein